MIERGYMRTKGLGIQAIHDWLIEKGFKKQQGHKKPRHEGWFKYLAGGKRLHLILNKDSKSLSWHFDNH